MSVLTGSVFGILFDAANAPVDGATRVPAAERADVVISARGATKRYGKQVAVDGINLQIAEGTTLGVIGPSGSGKTTAVRLLLGITAPTAGEVTVFGVPPARFSSAERQRIGYMPQLGVLDPNLSLQENLHFAASLYGLPLNRGDRLRRALELVELEGDAHKLLRDASGGMQRRVALAAALLHEPDLLFLDEPTAGIDPVLRRTMWDHFGRLKAQGRTLVVTTQYIGEAAYCDLVAVIAEGRLIALDTPEGLRRRAFGGELVHVRLAAQLDDAALAAVRRLEGALGVERAGNDGREVRVLVADAGATLPHLQRWFESQGLRVVAAEPHLPSYDDVFVALITRAGR